MRPHSIRPILSTLSALIVVGCATASTKDDTDVPYSAAPIDAPEERNPSAVVAAADRTEKDRELDTRRRPADMLAFMGIEPGWRVADLGAGSGYTTELLVRAVGPMGAVWAQNNARTLEKFVGESWPARLARPIMKDVVRLDRELNDPLPDDLKGLDAVTMIFVYHDAVAQETDRTAMLANIFGALRPGGVFIIADHHAPTGSGLAAANDLHRLEEQIVIDEVTAAGFVLDGTSDVLKDPNDDRTAISFKINFETDRYLLRFKKPAG